MMTSLQTQQHELMDRIEADWKNGKSSVTVVEPTQNYAKETRRCLTTVTFVPDRLVPAVFSKLIHPLRAVDPQQYFFPPDALHMTMKNIRTVSNPPLFTPQDVERVRDAFARVAPSLPAFQVHLGRLIELPTSVGIRVTTDQSFMIVVHALNVALQEAGIPDNKTYISSEIFFSNVTICRYTHPVTPAFQEKISQLKNIEFGSWIVKEMSLVICNSVCHPATRTVVATFPFAS